MIHESGITLSTSEKQRLTESAISQSEKIEHLLQITKGGLTSFEIEDTLKQNRLIAAVTPLTSIRRALTDLHKDSASPVEKTGKKRQGRYGVEVHIYRWQEPVEAGQGSLFGEYDQKHAGAFSQ